MPTYRDATFALSLILLSACTAPDELPSLGGVVAQRFDAATLEQNGYLSVLDHGADPTGATLSTQAFRDALAAGDSRQLAVLVPTGTYLIDDTLLMHKSSVTGRAGNALVGSTLGARPVLRLADSATGFDSPSWSSFKPMLHVVSECNPSEPDLCEDEQGIGNFIGNNFSQMVRNLHFDCGSNNSGCVGIWFAAAQWSSIEEVSVDLSGSGPGDEAWCGIYNVPSAGWGTVMVEIVGGRYGIHVGESAGSTLVGTVLRDQTVESLVHPSSQAMTLVGFEITKESGPVLRDNGGYRYDLGSRAVNMIDGTITLRSGGTAFDNGQGRALYLRNVYVTGADTLVQSGTRPAAAPAGTWTRIEEYSFADFDTGLIGTYEEPQVIVDGAAGPVETLTVTAAAPPDDLVTRHVWDRHPSFEDADVCNAKDPPYDATGDGTTDDRAALQSAIDACPKVFLPAGTYVLNDTLILNSVTILFGAQRHTSRIVHGTLASWAPTAPVPIVQTVDDSEATTWLSTLSIRSDKEIPVANDFFVYLHWRAGRRSMVSGVAPTRSTWTDPSVLANREANDHSQVLISDSGGGRWYFLGNEDRQRSEHPNFHQLEVVSTTEPLTFYNSNPEKAYGDVAWSFTNAANVRIYGSKTEPVRTAWQFDSVVNVAMMGWGAHASPPTGRAIFEVIDSDTLLFANLIERGNSGTYDILRERRGGNDTVWVDDTQSLSLFKRGTIDDAAMDHGIVATGNRAPVVDAGADQTIIWPTDFVDLAASANDSDGPSALTLAWNLVSGPATVTFADASQAVTRATFLGPGAFVLRLTADDGEASASDDVAITVVPAAAGDVQIPKVATAPTIDGVLGSEWDGSSAAADIDALVHGASTGAADLMATVRTSWDEDHLYVGVEVTDDLLVADSGSNDWQDDGVEIYIDAHDDDASAYGDDDYRYRFRYGDAVAWEGEHSPASLTGVSFAFADTVAGYRLEVAFPWTTLAQIPSVGGVFGLDVHVTDDDDGGDRDAKLAWFGSADTAWQDPSTLGTASLACDSTVCPPTLGLGEACAGPLECLSGYCADGVCCDAACDQPCAACSASGTCDPVPNGDVAGNRCSPLVCDGVSLECPTTCADDADCLGDRVCAGGRCGAPVPTTVEGGCDCRGGETPLGALLTFAVLAWRRRH